MTAPRLVIAIDFGTHASGFAYASIDERAKQPNERAMTLYLDWPGMQVFKYFKTRTALLRSASGEILAWGNQAHMKIRRQLRQDRAGALQYKEGFKLDLTSNDSTTRDQAVKDAVDYLGLLRKEALRFIQSQAINVPEEQVRSCITMPVAVVEGLEGYDSVLRDNVTGPAGFPATDSENLLLVLGGRAAALYCQAERGMPKERFTVIDAGSGYGRYYHVAGQ